MFPLANGMALDGKTDDLVDETLGDLVKVDKEAASVSEHIERLVEVFAVVNLLDQLDNDF